jgi:hypothetical protein
MGQSVIDLNAGADEDATARLKRDGRAAIDRCIDEFNALGFGDRRREHLSRVISILSFAPEPGRAN